MTVIAPEHFTQALLQLLDETFDNAQGLYLDQGTSLFETLAGISAAEASIPVGGKCPTLAAQVKHFAFLLDFTYYSVTDPAYPQADWGEIWHTVKGVTPGEWRRAGCATLRPRPRRGISPGPAQTRSRRRLAAHRFTWEKSARHCAPSRLEYNNMQDYETYRKQYFTHPAPPPRYDYAGLFGMTLYFSEYPAAVAYYQSVLGPPAYVEGDHTRGWKIGPTWLTFARHAAARSTPNHNRHANPEQAERLQTTIAAGGG
jgi:hypothetical protein